MAQASIPVDLFNPGQVFACLGFLEAAEQLLGDVAGGFDWSHGENAVFVMHAQGNENPFGSVLEFLAKANLERWEPHRYIDPKQKSGTNDEDTNDRLEQAANPQLSLVFPSRRGSELELPIRLQATDFPTVCLSHWADGSSRSPFKLYAGNRSAYHIPESVN